MPLSASGTAHLSFTSRAPSVVVLGADALLAALPATPVQLAHACLRAGYQHVVPASWGDELVAGAVVHALAGREPLPAIQCSCPIVAHRLLAVGTELRPFLVSFVAPPVALARYLRAMYGTTELSITYVGRCPAAADVSIDARLTPEELLDSFTQRRIVVAAQPEVFDSVIPPDRRRYVSQPGGVPSTEALWSTAGARRLVELGAEDFSVDLTQLLLSDEPVLIDAGAALGCVCSGAGAGNVEFHRARLIALEPPRSQTPIVDRRVPVSLELPLPTSPRQAPSAPGIAAPPAAKPQPAPTAESAVARGLDAAAPDTGTYEAAAAPVEERPARPAESGARTELDREKRAPESGPRHDRFDDERVTVPDERAAAFAAAAQPAATGHAHGERLVASVAEESADLEPRGAARGAPRAVLGELPMRRRGDGRRLPRAYVLHRRLSPRNVPLIPGTPTPPVAVSAPTTPPAATAAAGVEHPAPMIAAIEEQPIPAPMIAAASTHEATEATEVAGLPEHVEGAEAAPGSAAPGPESTREVELAVGGTIEPAPAREARASSAPRVPTLPVMPASALSEAPATRARPPRPTEARRGMSLGPRGRERAVMLPVDRASDEPSRAATQDARMQAPTGRATTTAAPASRRRRWLLLILLVALLALASAALGAALGAWITRERVQASNVR